MKKNMAIILNLFTLLILITILFCGCGQSNQKQNTEQLSSQTEPNSDKIPGQLNDIEKGIEKVILTLEGPSVTSEEQKSNGSQQSSSNSQIASSKNEAQSTPDKQSSSQNTKQEQSTSKDNTQKQSSSQTKLSNEWEEVIPLINSLHFKWNNYMPLAVKIHSDSNLLENFSESLNNLTNTLIDKNDKITLLAANDLYYCLSEFYTLYKTKTSPEIKKVRYYLRNAILNSSIDNWTKAKNDIHNLSSSWTISKNTMDKSQQELANKLDLSINEFSKVVLDMNKQLAEIKGKVALTNVEAIEKSNEKLVEQKG